MRQFLHYLAIPRQPGMFSTVWFTAHVHTRVRDKQGGRKQVRITALEEKECWLVEG